MENKPKLETLADLRKEIKKLGYNVKTKTLSFGRHATYVSPSGRELTFNVATSKGWEQWKPLLDFVKDNREEIKHIGKSEGVRGLLL